MGRWHKHVRPLVEQYGPGLVYSRGLRILGFPPTWLTDLSEVWSFVDRFHGG